MSIEEMPAVFKEEHIDIKDEPVDDERDILSRFLLESNLIDNNPIQDMVPLDDLHVRITADASSLSNDIDLDQLSEMCCAHCDYRTQYKYSLIEHLAKKHHKGPKRPPRYFCTECSYGSFHRGHVNRHMWHRHGRDTSAAHTMNREYACCLCNSYVSRQKANLERHIRSHLKLQQISLCAANSIQSRKARLDTLLATNAKIHRCNECEFMSTFPGNLTRHLTEKHSPSHLVRVHNCSECGKKFKRRADMVNHIKRIHST